MTDPEAAVTLTVDADTQGLERRLAETGRIGRQFADTLASSFGSAAQRGRGLADVLDTLASRLQALALKQGLRTLEQGLEQLVTGALSGGLEAGRAAASPVPAAGAATQRGAAPVIVNVTTPDAESFRRSETQIAALVARAAALGQRNL